MLRVFSSRFRSGHGGEELLAQIEPWRLKLNPGGSESTLEAQIEPWSLRLSLRELRHRFRTRGSDWGAEA